MNKNKAEQKKTAAKKPVASKTTKTVQATKNAPVKKSVPAKIEKPMPVKPPVDENGNVMMRVGKTQYIKAFCPAKAFALGDFGGKRIGVIGDTGCGKSTVVKCMIKEIKTIPFWTIISPAEKGNRNFTDIVENESQIHFTVDENIVIDFRDRQEWVYERWHIPGTNHPKKYISDPQAAIVLDDMCEDDTLLKRPIFKWLFFISRNLGTTVFLLVQYHIMIPKNIRKSGMSHVVLFFQEKGSITDTYKEFAKVFPKQSDYETALEEIVKVKFRAMVISKMTQSNKIEEKVFYYQGRPMNEIGEFKVGTPDVNERINKMFDKNWKERADREKEERLKAGIEEPKAGKSKKGKSKKVLAEEDEEMEVVLC